MFGVCTGDLWVPLLFIMFNAGDVAGRVLVGRGLGRLKGWPGPRLFTYSIMRLVLLLCMAFCRVATPRPWRLPALLKYVDPTPVQFDTDCVLK